MIRPATPADWTAIERLLTSSGLTLDGADVNAFIVAEQDGTIAGCAALERYGKRGLLRSVAVDPTRRGSGLGELLVGQIIETARDEGIRSVVLLTTTAPDWFPRFGFHSTAREEVPAEVKASAEFRGACPNSAVLMSLDL